MDAIKIVFTDISKKYSNKEFILLIASFNSQENEDKFNFLASEPSIKFSKESLIDLHNGNLKAFLEVARTNFENMSK
jgi:hypothetical protein